MKTVGDTIREHRIAKNLTQKELGEKLFLSKQTISKWENGRSLPDIETTKKIIKILEIAPDKILADIPEEESAPTPRRKKKFVKIILIAVAVIVFLSLVGVIIRNSLVSGITLGIGAPVITATDHYNETIVVSCEMDLSDEEVACAEKISEFTEKYLNDISKYRKEGYQYEIKAYVEVRDFKTTIKYSGEIVKDAELIGYDKEITLDFIPAKYDKFSDDRG